MKPARNVRVTLNCKIVSHNFQIASNRKLTDPLHLVIRRQITLFQRWHLQTDSINFQYV